MEEGIHEGTTAIGRYGLMPNTVQEFHKRRKAAGHKDYNPDILSADPRQIEELVKSNPELEQQAARFMAEHLIKKTGGDLGAAAYGWRYGHNYPAETLIQKSVDNPYVSSFNKYLGQTPIKDNNFSNLKSKLRKK
jgi:hypothetical protein